MESTTTTIFTYSTLISKIIILFSFVVFSYIHADASFISVHPRLFITESILAGSLIGLPFMWMMHNRGVSWASTIPIGLSCFTLFYFIHVFMEFSGANKKADEATKSKFVKWTTIIITSSLLLISLLVHDFTPSFGIILLETFILALSGALLEVFKSYNRGHTDYMKKFLSVFGLISITNLILQFGGVYSKISVPLNNFQY
jgi:hypothetical protein